MLFRHIPITPQFLRVRSLNLPHFFLFPENMMFQARGSEARLSEAGRRTPSQLMVKTESLQRWQALAAAFPCHLAVLQLRLTDFNMSLAELRKGPEILEGFGLLRIMLKLQELVNVPFRSIFRNLSINFRVCRISLISYL